MSDRSGCEAGSTFREIDLIRNVLGDDQVRVSRSVFSRQRDDEVSDSPSLLGRERIGKRRHGRAVEPGAHRPEDVLASRAAAERPVLRQVCRADGMVPVVFQSWSRRTIATTEGAVTLDAAGVHEKLLASLNRFLRGFRRARKLNGLGHPLRVGELGREGRQEIGDIRYFLVGKIRPGWHGGVGHAAPDDVDQILMCRQCAVRRRANLELAGGEVTWSRA